tara:strand:- start:25716 stop:26540 length:825 start_codon:yes stop_codon:yes gene_type:complete
MQLGIVGLGVVGSAIKYGFEKLGNDVAVHDIAQNTNIEDVLSSEIVYICVPTPSDSEGNCDTSIVESVVDELVNKNYEGIIAIKSTVEPGTTERLIKKHEGRKICFVPEFLRERMASCDFTENHTLLVVGVSSIGHAYEQSVQGITELIVKSHGKYPNTFMSCSPTEAELIKYAHNTINSTRITWANSMYEICKSLDCNYDIVKESILMTSSMPDLYLDVNENFRGYSGACLVKDTLGLAKLCEKLDNGVEFFDKIHSENEKYDKTVLPGMRPE